MMLLTGAILLLVSLYVYAALTRQVFRRAEVVAPASGKQFGLPEAAVALGLIVLLGSNLWKQASATKFELKTELLIASVVFTVGLIVLLVVFLKLRGFSPGEITGISEVGFERALITGIVLIALAYPLVLATDWIVVKLGSGESSRQEIVELFSSLQSLTQRIIVILLAVVVAPVTEEFVFRFFLYKVIRRYGGRVAALLVTGLLFAAVHAHLPSFAPLFVLAVCLSLGYEWSGTLLVPMTMHSVFNALTMIALAFPQTLGP